jgi:hypothetical protein
MLSLNFDMMHVRPPVTRSDTQEVIHIENRTRLNLDTLDVLMRVSLDGFGVEFMDWNGIFES